MEKEIEYEIIRENLSSFEIETIDIMNDNININNLAKDYLNNYKVLLNEYNSCYFNSYLVLFTNAILPNISNSDLLNNNHYLYNINLNDDF